jgi:hypothetical protein
MTRFVTDFIVNGIVGGLVATFLTLVIRNMWLRVVVPWYEERVYHDARFEGMWEGTETFSDTHPSLIDHFSMEIRRQGHRVEAMTTCLDGPDKGRVYVSTGSFKNLILTLSWSPRDDTSLERGTVTAKLVENGKRLVGHGAFYSPATEKVHASAFEATRRS